MKFLADIFANLLLRPLIGAIRFLPERFGMFLAHGIIRAIFFFLPRLDHIAQRNLELIFPTMSADERTQIRVRSYEVLARNIFFFAKIPDLKKADFERMFDYQEASEILKRLSGKGRLFLTLHFGYFELLAQAQTILDKPYFIVARDLGLPMLDRWWRRRREWNGSTVISRAGATKEVIRRLSEGESAALLFDQNVKSNHAAFVSFFGRPAATTKTAALAALRAEVPILVTTSVEVAPHRFKMLVREIAIPTEGTVEERTQETLERCHRAAEEFIRAYPEQWFWIHRRFKTRPPGESGDLYG